MESACAHDRGWNWMSFKVPTHQTLLGLHLTSRSYLAIMALDLAHFPLFWCFRLIRSWGKRSITHRAPQGAGPS